MTIVEKIRALLAKAASTDNEHEAEVFLAKAHDLMEKHQLESTDLEHDDPLGNERVYRRNNPDGVDWDFMLIFPLARYFGCRACRCTVRHQYAKGPGRAFEMDLVGRESARITTMEMHNYLVKTVRRLGKKAAAEQTFKTYKKFGKDKFYWTGDYLNADQASRRIGNALRTRLGELNAKSRKPEPATPSGKNALITLDSVNALYEKLHPEAGSINGTYFTNSGARKIAEGIGLNLQTGGSDGPALLEGK